MSIPRATVVVIVLDGERFLDEAIESVVSQSMVDWELFIVDDGSRDRTAEIAERHAGRDSRIGLLAHPRRANRGMSASRNLGLRAARGEYVVFLDHDDAFEPEKLERLATLLEATSDAMAAVGPNLRWRSWSGAAGDCDLVQDLGVEPGLLAPPGLIPKFLSRPDATPLGPMVRRKAALELGGYDEAFRSMYEDQAFLSRLMLRMPVVATGELLHRYRLHEDSCVARAHRSGRRLAARRRFLHWLRGEARQVSDELASQLAPVIELELEATRGWALRLAQRTMINLAARIRGSGPRT